MNKIIVTPKAASKLREMKNRLTEEHGAMATSRILREIKTAISRLKTNAYLGVSISALFQIETDYRKIYVAHNHVFYRYDCDTVYIIDVFHEKEDFLMQMFGISSIDEEAERYWDEIEWKSSSEE